MTLVTNELTIYLNKGAQPYQSFSMALEFRNRMAHPKREVLSGASKEFRQLGPTRVPAAKWEKLRTSRSAARIVADMRALFDMVNGASPEPLLDIHGEYFQDGAE